MDRLTSKNLATLGAYLFGPRWQAPLARALRVDYSLVKHWKSGGRPVSRCKERAIAELVHETFSARMKLRQTSFLDMLASLSEETKAALLPTAADNVAESKSVLYEDMPGLTRLAREKSAAGFGESRPGPAAQFRSRETPDF
jgi:hypothetical protein